jgi:hypothetical protein
MKQQNTGFVNTFRNIYFNFVLASGGASPKSFLQRPSATAWSTGFWSSARGTERGEICANHQQSRPEARNPFAKRRPDFRKTRQADLQLNH